MTEMTRTLTCSGRGFRKQGRDKAVLFLHLAKEAAARSRLFKGLGRAQALVFLGLGARRPSSLGAWILAAVG